MNTQIRQLWRETGKNLLISIALFTAFFVVLYAIERFSPAMSGKLLHFDNLGFCIGIPASVIGVGYVLTIRNPANFTGFYPGIAMSALLGCQMLAYGDFVSTFLYFVVFIPFQIMSIVAWSKPKAKGDVFCPKFLEIRPMLYSLLFVVAACLAVYALEVYAFGNDNVLKIVLRGLFLASAILANFWLIYKKNDSWIYWVIYSVVGIAIFALENNLFSIVLFIFFLVINAMAGCAWIKGTPKENFGWLKQIVK